MVSAVKAWSLPNIATALGGQSLGDAIVPCADVASISFAINAPCYDDRTCSPRVVPTVMLRSIASECVDVSGGSGPSGFWPAGWGMFARPGLLGTPGLVFPK